ncbi:MAG: DUF3887 domain-containing protein [Clostridiaceae bacterium]|nr:DUF3887 domain-containing protein [Clostridiaceae bacterium]
MKGNRIKLHGKRLTLLACGLCLVLLLAACQTGALPEGMDKDAVCERGMAVVDVINTGDYDAMVHELREDLRPQLTADDLRKAWDEKLTSLGGFKEYQLIQAVGTKTDGVPYAVVVLNCAYENGTATFTLSFDTDYQLAGMYMK